MIDFCRRNFLGALLAVFWVCEGALVSAQAGLLTEITMDEERQKERGCSVAQRLGAGETEAGDLTTEERLDLSYLKQSDPEEYDRCYGSGAAYRREPNRRQRTTTGKYAPLPYQAKVVQVDDGNTLLLSTGQRVDLIGVQIPPGESAPKAAAFLRRLVANQEVRLQYDREQKDRFGRLLAYVFLEETFVNRAVIESGFAEALISPPNKLYERQLLGLAEERWEEDDYYESIRKRTEGQIYNAWGMMIASGGLMIFFLILRRRLRGK
jgi:endonuclease YncB( thermonuclease family)